MSFPRRASTLPGQSSTTSDVLADQRDYDAIAEAVLGLAATYAPIAKGVTNGDSHDHNGGDGAQIDHVNLANKGTNTHAQIDTFISTAAATYAGVALGVTNGNSHDHNGGDGAQIDHVNLANKGTNTHSQIDSHIGSTSNPHSTSDANISISAITTNNASTSKHGFCPALSNVATEFLNGQGNWSAPAGTAALSTFDAIIYPDTGAWSVKNNAGTVTASQTTAALAMTNAISLVPAIGGSIFIYPTYSLASLVLTRGNIAFITPTGAAQISGHPVTIEYLELDSNSAELSNITFHGIYSNMLKFNARNSNDIHDNIHFNRCYVTSLASATAEGVVFGGDSTGGTFQIHFNHCAFYDQGQSARKAFFSVIAHEAGNGQWIFNDCDYTTGSEAKNYVMWALENGGSISPFVNLNGFNIVTQAGGTSLTILKIFDGSAPQIGMFNCHDSWIEASGAPITMFVVEAQSTVPPTYDVTFHHNGVSDQSHTVTLLDQNDVSGGGDFRNFTYDHNMGEVYGGTVLGDVGTDTKLVIRIHDNGGLKTENTGNQTGNGSQQTIAHGCNFTPAYNQVLLSERTTGGALAYQSAAPDATNIYVTATNAKDYVWKVRHDA